MSRNNNWPVGWTPPSGREPAALDPPLLEPDNSQYESSDEPFYGERAGGWRLTFGKYKEERLNEVPYSYLKWCKDTLQNARVFQHAFDKYREGLISCINDKYADFRVPIGKKHRGRCLGECRDKPWLIWLLRWANSHPTIREKYDIFLMAVQKYLDSPRHQGVHRDIGERLLPEEYEFDANGADVYDDDEYDPRDIDDANENGDLKGFIDDLIHYDTDKSENESESSEAEESEDASDLSKLSDSDLTDSDGSLGSDDDDYCPDTPPPATPRRKDLRSHKSPLREAEKTESSSSSSSTSSERLPTPRQNAKHTPQKKRVAGPPLTPKHIIRTQNKPQATRPPKKKSRRNIESDSEYVPSELEEDPNIVEEEETLESSDETCDEALPQTPRRSKHLSSFHTPPPTGSREDSEDDTPLPDLRGIKRRETPTKRNHMKQHIQFPPTPSPTPMKKRKAEDSFEIVPPRKHFLRGRRNSLNTES